MLKRKRPVIDALDESGFIIDLDAPPPDEMSATEYHHTIIMNGWYLRYVSMSGLVDSAWCTAMGITRERHIAYKQGRCRVPESILNRAYTVYRRLKTVVQSLNRRWENA